MLMTISAMPYPGRLESAAAGMDVYTVVLVVLGVLDVLDASVDGDVMELVSLGKAVRFRSSVSLLDQFLKRLKLFCAWI